MRLKACLNGARHPAEHPALPVTPAALAADAAAVLAVGADAVHLHVKDAEGIDTLNGDALAAVLVAVRGTAPSLPVGVTTGAWSVPDPAERVAAVRRWTALPDFASVNWHEPGAEQVATTLLERDVGVEAGLWHVDAVDAWLASPNRDRCARVLLELPTASTRPPPMPRRISCCKRSVPAAPTCRCFCTVRAAAAGRRCTKPVGGDSRRASALRTC